MVFRKAIIALGAAMLTAAAAGGGGGAFAAAEGTSATVQATTASLTPSPSSTASTASAPSTSPAPSRKSEIPLQFYQIAIEAIIVEVNEKYSREIGIQWTYGRERGDDRGGVDVNAPMEVKTTIVPRMNIIPGGFRFEEINRAAGVGFSLTDLDVGNGMIGARLRALLEEGHAQIRSRPMAVTLNKQMVKIETVDKVPYQDVLFSPAGTGQMAIQFEPVGVKLHVLPDIKSLDEELIDLDLVKLEVSAVGRFITIGNVQRPVFLKSEANTKVVVRNHDTLIIGGFKIEHDRTAGQGVPFIRRVPVLKYLFSNENKAIERRDILFYITPHILPPGIQPTLPPKFENRPLMDDVMLIPPIGSP
ncbi:MAG: hypothetical protein N3D11_10350 [Candidatus Sumerlaeia bacterium]|nr:hypothetical protein [Candidatus Sumerlaeia bacterium]